MRAPPYRRSRATAIGATAFLMLALPFLVLGVFFLGQMARMDLRCEPQAPCVLTRSSWLGQEEVGRYAPQDILGVKVDRSRSRRSGAAPIFRPQLETASGPQPLAFQWTEDEAEATAFAQGVQRYLAGPRTDALAVFRDDRKASLRVGGAFTGVGLLVLAVSLWLLSRTLAHRKAERAALP
ncbi:hypothetical protein D7Y13_16920 [Corallococcus praedator]|uniref:DUF3592 domain-containing protein n=1 Tax=Corallococcus praedator TaxID=2316724 RepID=A0ABX9QH69_9BACT|nr:MULTISPECIES: hypothetical protein [Corallococcus]RKH13568.1 hypothetical protein D7X74_21640 [Corallococcus sp. CA047B]RKH28436.1 hypothetical protein D7X75_24700 [Corallococcus sp. CA031C]RKI07927.1 hypothetical protein D7Y13_16920 [Corallococcus praedator]